MKIRTYALEISVFVCGAVVMIFELVGSRVLGPYFGTSIFVWTSLIGIILGSLSLGYYLGGKFVDKNPRLNSLALIIFLGAVSIGLTAFVKDGLLVFLQSNLTGVRTGSVVASLILFLPASLLLGMVSPYAAKLKINNLSTSGRAVGNLYALSTAGSIVGTFLSGFYLIPQFGTNKLLIILSLILLIVSVALSMKQLMMVKLLTLMIIVFGWWAGPDLNLLFAAHRPVDVDTAYNRIFIREYGNRKTGQVIRTLSINNENSSAMFVDSDKLVYDYTKYYHLARHFNPGFKKALMLGGAGYSYPKSYLSTYKEASIDVVEIDPGVTELAKTYFNLKEQPRLRIFHEDGRVYLNKTKETYDVIFGDAFTSHYSLPYQLTTREAVRRHSDVLADDGIVILNIISAIEGERGEFLRAEYATYKSVFPQVYLFPVGDPDNGKDFQNIILVALKTKASPIFSDSDPELNQYLQHLWSKEVPRDIPVLTDDHAPVDYYISKML